MTLGLRAHMGQALRERHLMSPPPLVWLVLTFSDLDWPGGECPVQPWPEGPCWEGLLPGGGEEVRAGAEGEAGGPPPILSAAGPTETTDLTLSSASTGTVHRGTSGGGSTPDFEACAE